MTDEPLTICPECGGTIRRVLFPAGVVFKGSGFYKTDHNGSGSAASENGHDKKKSESEKAGSAKEGETKTASESSSETSSAKSSENKVPASTK
jgi:predicted nucleic acid-binding Zn ribbon protein